MENKQAGISIKDHKGGRPLKFYADSFKFYNGGATPGPGYDLKDRFDDVESDMTAVTSSATSNASAVAAEAARAQQAEGANAAAVAVANAARGALQSTLVAADAVLTAAVSAEAVSRIAGDTAEASARASAITVEQQRAVAAEASLQGQITNILGTSPAHLDSLQEVVQAFQSADGTLSGTVGSMETRLAVIEALMDQLLNQS